MKGLRLISIFMIFAVFTACLTTVDTTIPEEITAEELFFKAQVQQGKIKTIKDYEEVINLYKKIEIIFPEYKTIILESKYEIAFLNYQQKNYDEAEMMFYEILKIHEKDTTNQLPKWSKKLSEIMLVKIEEIKAKKSKLKKKKEKKEEPEENEDFYDSF